MASQARASGAVLSAGVTQPTFFDQPTFDPLPYSFTMSAPHQSSEITLRLEAAAEAALRARFPQEAQQGLEAALAAALDPRGLAPDVFPANCFAAGGAILNRHNNSRDDVTFISGRLNDPETRYLVFVHLSPLQADKRMTFHARSSKLVTSLMDTDSVKSDVVLLGQLTGADASTPTGKSGREMAAHTEEREREKKKRRPPCFPSFLLSLPSLACLFLGSALSPKGTTTS